MALHVLKGPFTVNSYQRLAELGVLREDDRVELIAGQVVQMTPIGERHAACVRYILDRLSHALHDVALVDAQNPVVLDDHHVPQPDVAVLRRRSHPYRTHPRAADVLLVIEVADTSLAYDRDVKIPLYARAGIPEAWLVNLPADRVEIYCDPRDGKYAVAHVVSRGGTIAPRAFPGLIVSVDGILG